MKRRGFLGACIATLAAPAIVRASSLMPVRARPAGGYFGTIESFRFIKTPAVPELERAQLDDLYLQTNPPIVCNLGDTWVNLDEIRPGKVFQLRRVGWTEIHTFGSGGGGRA